MVFRELKTQAKAALREHFGAKMLLMIIPILIEVFGVANNNSHTLRGQSQGITFDIAYFVSLLIGLIVAYFVIILVVAGAFNYLQIFRGKLTNPKFSNLFVPFRDGSAGKIFMLVFIQAIITVVLLFIPIIGWIFLIYLGLGWSQSIYVLYDQIENGTYRGTMNVLRTSSNLMKGYRGNYFLFHLSFILWYILIWITFGLAAFWVIPYIQMSSVAYYEELTENS